MRKDDRQLIYKANKVQIIKKKEERINRKSGGVITNRLRVSAYCRVSSNSKDQKNSYESQLQYYNDKINSNLEWSFSGIYADEAISGTLDYKRSDFMRMIENAIQGKIDLILTKSISRFARNTLDTLKYVRLLKEHKVAILFEEENINTLKMDGEMMLTIFSSFAQQESETISSHVKLGLKMKMEQMERYFERDSRTIRRGIKKMCDAGYEKYRYYENNKVVISSQGIEWLCKNALKHKYLELLENYKMELTEQFIRNDYYYDNYF